MPLSTLPVADHRDPMTPRPAEGYSLQLTAMKVSTGGSCAPLTNRPSELARPPPFSHGHRARILPLSVAVVHAGLLGPHRRPRRTVREDVRRVRHRRPARRPRLLLRLWAAPGVTFVRLLRQRA